MNNNEADTGYLETLRHLKELSKEESFVLYYRLKGDSLSTIATNMVYSEVRVQDFSSRIYKEFDLTGRDWATLRSITEKIMMDVAQPLGWKNWVWPTDKLEEKIRQATTPQWQERFQALAGNRIVQIIAFVIVVLICCGIIAISNLPRFVGAILTPAPTRTSTRTRTPIPPTQTYTPITPTLTPSNTPTITLTPTITDTPTVTPSPTDTLIPTATEDVFFYQDFSDGRGFDPRWNIVNQDNSTIYGGSYTGDWIYLDTEGLKNFEITVIGQANSTGGGSGIYIAPAYVNPVSWMGFYTNYLQRGWGAVKNDSQIMNLPAGDHNFDPRYKLKIVITVMNGNMDLVISDIPFNSAYNNKLPFGKIGFTAKRANIYSIKIIRLP
jgi:hypothetical protein